MIRELNKYAMQNGLIFGFYGVLSLILQRYAVHVPLLGIINWAMVIYSIFLMIRLTKNYRSKVINPRVGFTFGNAYLHSVLTAYYSMIIIAAVAYVYLEFIDKGAYIREITELVQQTMNQSGKQVLPGMKKTMEEMKNIRPEQFSMSIITGNILLAPILSLIVAAVCKKNPSFNNIENNNTKTAI